MDVEKREPGIDLTEFTVTVFLYDKRYVPRSSLSRVQGYPQDGRHRRVKKDRERDKERTTQGEQASSVSEARLLYFPRGFYTLSYTYSKVKNAESTQPSISNNFYRYQVPSCTSLIFCTLSSGLDAC